MDIIDSGIRSSGVIVGCVGVLLAVRKSTAASPPPDLLDVISILTGIIVERRLLRGD